jgi:hypothetical protein
LILFRATKKCQRAVSIPQCPKSALNKLADKAPWRRPEVADYHGLTNVDSTATQNDNKNNNYQASMKKNIHLLDLFLQAVAGLCGEEDSGLSKAWCLFSQPQDTHGVVLPRQLAPSNELLPRTKLNEEDVRNAQLDMSSPTTTTIQSCRLGQYFCSPATAKQIVSLAMDFVRNHKHTHHGPVTFLEPSCGHGDIVWQLFKQLDEDSKIADYKVVAYDLDTNAIESCRQRVEYKDKVEWIAGDFLQSKPDSRESATLVVLGGPPYTSGAGSGARLEKDLPFAFLSCCVDVWKASFVAFILPVRYEASPMQVPGFTVQSHELESSTFFFQGEQKVTQPSIIHCYSQVHA